MATTEKKVSHSPGPWETSSTYAQVIAGKIIVCEMHVNEKVSDDEFTFEEWRANAKLIAAAPELLEALQWLIKQVPELKGEISLFGMQKCYDAIKKATE